MKNEKLYILKRMTKAWLQSMLFYACRIFPIQKDKIVFCCIEGTTGYTCNPKYIAKEIMAQKPDYELVWLVNDPSKQFDDGIKVCQNTLFNRAFHLSTAHIWIDNSRKQLEVRKRKGQIYIQTWHAKLGFKPTCLDRGSSFSRIAYLVSKHDSDMVDYWLSNSDWYDHTLKTGSLYEGKTIRFGSPRCDVLLNKKDEWHRKIRVLYGIPGDAKILMYAPTFRGGSQATNRSVSGNDEHMPDLDRLVQMLQERFGGKWYVMLRLHPQLTARQIVSRSGVSQNFASGNVDSHNKITGEKAAGNSAKTSLEYIFTANSSEANDISQKDRLIDVSRYDDMYELLAGCDAFMTDYSSAAFDAAVMKMPIILYADDYKDYIAERGSLLWKLEELPFLLAENEKQLEIVIRGYDEEEYQKMLERFFEEYAILEDGCASKRVVEKIKEWV